MMKKKINWVTTLFLILTPIAGLAALFIQFSLGSLHWQTGVFFAVMWVATGMSITGGYHRLYSHKAYEAAWPIRLLFMLFGAASFEGSILEWCTDHRNHHRHTDTEKDPYSIHKGFWFAHILWLFFLDPTERDFSNVDDLTKDPLVRFQHRHYVPLAIFMGFIFPMLLACLWGDPWGGLLIAGSLRIAVTQQFTFCINSVCHYFGDKTYSIKQSARDHWFAAFLTFGEGYHNFHHQFSADYRNAIRWYQFDPTKWLIRFFACLGWAWNLKRINPYIIMRYRIKNEAVVIEQTLPRHSRHLLDSVHALQEKILVLGAKIEELDQKYISLKHMRIFDFNRKLASYKQKIKEHRLSLLEMKKELQVALIDWVQLYRLSHSAT